MAGYWDDEDEFDDDKWWEEEDFDEEDDEELEEEDEDNRPFKRRRKRENEEEYFEEEDDEELEETQPFGQDQEEEEEQASNQEEKLKVKEENEGGEEKVKGQKPRLDKMIKKARSLELTPIVLNFNCPHCHQRSLFPDKFSKNMMRGVGTGMLAVAGLASLEMASSIKRYVCLNPKCKEYYCRTGTKMYKDSSEKIQTKKSIFHVI